MISTHTRKQSKEFLKESKEYYRIASYTEGTWRVLVLESLRIIIKLLLEKD